MFDPDQFLAQSSAPDVSGFDPDSFVADANEEKYGGVSGGLKAAGAALLRGATIGLSDPLLTETGLVKPETLKGLEETNPTISFGSEVVGTVAPAFIEGPLAILNLPGWITKGGAAVTKSVAKALPAGASAAKGALSLGTGMAAEGAVYGLGNAISEASLGDTDLLSEKTLADIGISAAFSGGLGSIVGSVAGKYGRDFAADGEKLLASERLKAENPLSGESAILHTDVSPKEKLNLIQAIQRQKKNAEEIREAGKILGAPVLPGQTSDVKLIQNATSALSKSPTIAGTAVQESIGKGYRSIDNVLQETLGSAEKLSPYEAGEKIKNQVIEKFDSVYEPIKQMYKDREASGQFIKLSDDAILELHDDILKSGNKFRNVTNPGRKIFKDAARDVVEEAAAIASAEGTSAMANLDAYSKSLAAQARAAAIKGDHDVSHALYQVRDKIENFVDKTFISASKELGDTAQAKQLVSDYKALKKNFAEFKGMMGSFVSDTKLGKRATTEVGLHEALEKIPNEKLVDKILDSKNYDGLKRLQENFPDVFNSLLQHKKSQILESAMKDGRPDVNKIIREIYNEKKISSKVRELMFTPEELKKLNASKTWIESLPKDINPSGTHQHQMYEKFMSSPVSATAQNLTSFVAKQLIESTATNSKEASRALTLIKASEAALKTTKRIKNGASAVFDKTKDVLPPKIFSMITSSNDYKEKTEEIKGSANDVASFVDRVSKETEGVFEHAPGVGQSLQFGMARAVNFLNSKIPDKPVGLFEKEFEPSHQEIESFKRYYDVVQNPMLSLKQVRDGTLTQETIETMATVFPKMFLEMKTELMNKIVSMKDPSKIPYSLRQSISMFMGEPIEQSFSPQVIQANQMAFVPPPQPQMQGMKPSKTGMQKMDVAKRTNLDKREDA